MAKRRTRRSQNWGKSCGCPTGSKRVSTKGRGRGFACLSTSFKTIKGRRMKPFVKAKCR